MSIKNWTDGSMNEVTMDGILNEINLQPSTDKNGHPVIYGDYVVKTTNKIGDKEFVAEVPIRVYQSQLTSKGTPNPAYDNAEKIMKEFVSVAAGGEENADYIRISSSGKLSENTFVSKTTGQLVSTPVIRASFANKIKKSDVQDGARFKTIIVIGKITPEISRDGVETGRLIIKGILPVWGGKVELIDFIVENPNVAKHIENNWGEGDTVMIGGYINFVSKTIETEEPSGFGEPIVTRRTISVKELVITGGHDAPLTEDEGAYDNDAIGAALAERKARMDEKVKAASQAASTPKSTGFGF